MKTSEGLTVGRVYTRVELAERFNITDATLKTGIFRPPGHDSVWLFVTEKKAPDQTQYQDYLNGDALSWDGQTSGRKDALIVGHEAAGLELLVFYRTSKNEFGKYGFRYEGPFAYLSHTGRNPARFRLRRVPAAQGQPIILKAATSAGDVGASLLTFNRQAVDYPERARSILRQTIYWVFHPESGTFGPGKFVGYENMDFQRYEQSYSGYASGARFDGHVSRKGIERALSALFRPEPGRHDQLRSWGNDLLGPDAFGNADPAKWHFVVLEAELPDSEQAAGWIDDTVADALEQGVERGQGFILDARLRKALEDHAMGAAERHFESLGYEWEDHSKGKPYDLRCRRDQEVLYVEVKGTQTDGTVVILTHGEVEFGRTHRGQMALFVLHSVQVTEGDDGFTLGDGQKHVVLPWDVDQGILRPLAYKYTLPGMIR